MKIINAILWRVFVIEIEIFLKKLQPVTNSLIFVGHNPC